MCTASGHGVWACVSEVRVDGVPRVRGVRHTWRHTRGRVRLCNLAWSLTHVCTLSMCTAPHIIDHATNLQPPTQSVSRFRCSLSVVTFGTQTLSRLMRGITCKTQIFQFDRTVE